MKQVNYILVHETVCKNTGCDVAHRDVPHIGHCIDINCGNRTVLIEQLCKLRKEWPKAKILGVSELDVSASHAPVRVNQEMNALRRELSDLP